ncbi:tyrosine-protein kinase ABL1-like [Tigriopus californicus]|uniref:tyrosine-protein kinase ABL1-like n=1 Tax=Tigriopus californicus TaxID=6832 RepID=UPI0027DAB33D|nr:tyrosine-protein kinase ABL1-like [Tigriopus californicus]
MFVVVQDFRPIASDEIPLHKGEFVDILIVGKSPGRWKVRNQDGNVGWVLSKCLSSREVLTEYSWFYGTMTRVEADRLLSEHFRINGAFFVWEREPLAGERYLSLGHNNENYHHEIQSNKDGLVFVRPKDLFTSIDELIQHYRRQAAGLPTRLRYLPQKRNRTSQFKGQSDKCEILQDDFAMTRKLGDGHFGEVYEAVWKRHNLTIAVKMLKGIMVEWSHFDMMCMEHLQHPNLVQLLGVCSEGSHISIITEFLYKGNLLSYLKNHTPVKEDLTVMTFMALQIASAMAYLESRPFGVVHG